MQERIISIKPQSSSLQHNCVRLTDHKRRYEFMCTHNYGQVRVRTSNRCCVMLQVFTYIGLKKFDELKRSKVGVMMINCELYEYEWVHKHVCTYELKHCKTGSQVVISFL